MNETKCRFVFGALIEYAVVNYIGSNEQKKLNARMERYQRQFEAERQTTASNSVGRRKRSFVKFIWILERAEIDGGAGGGRRSQTVQSRIEKSGVDNRQQSSERSFFHERRDGR